MRMLDAIGSRRMVLLVVGVAISVLATVLVTRDLDLGRTLRIAATAQPLLLIVAGAVIATQAGVRAYRWQWLLPVRADGSRVPYPGVLGAMLVGYLGNTVMPARLGEVVRSALIARREGLASAEALGSAVLERVLDVFVLAILGVLAVTLVAAPGWIAATATTAAIVAAVVLAVLGGAALFAARFRSAGAKAATDAGGTTSVVRATIERVIMQLTRGARVVDRPGLIALALACTLAAWLLDASVFWLVGQSLGLGISPGGAMLVSVLAVLSTAIPTAPGYIGTFEVAAVTALGVSGIVGEAALAFAVLAHVLAVIPLSLAGAVALWAGRWQPSADATRQAPAPR